MRRVFFVVVVAALTTPTFAAGQSWRDVSMSRQLRDNDPVRVYVEYGAGQFNVSSIDEGVLYRMNLHYDEDAFEPVLQFGYGGRPPGPYPTGCGPARPRRRSLWPPAVRFPEGYRGGAPRGP